MSSTHKVIPRQNTTPTQEIEIETTADGVCYICGKVRATMTAIGKGLYRCDKPSCMATVTANAVNGTRLTTIYRAKVIEGPKPKFAPDNEIKKPKVEEIMEDTPKKKRGRPAKVKVEEAKTEVVVPVASETVPANTEVTQ